MRASTFCIIGGLLLHCGCSGNHYSPGEGDAGQFILHHAIAFGGRPITTNGLPTISGDWKYIQDEFGIGIVLPSAQYEEVQGFVRAAFGPSTNSAGWSHRDVGVTIMVQKASDHTDVGIFPPMSDEKLGRAAHAISDGIDKKSQ